MYTIRVPRTNNYLAHHGVEGQKWGVRRWQNPDGSLTPEGRAHYGIEGKTSSDYKGISKKKRRAEHYNRIAQLEADEKITTDAIYKQHWDDYKNKNKETYNQYVNDFQKSGYSKEEAEKASDKVLGNKWQYDNDYFNYINDISKNYDDYYATKKEIDKYCKDVMNVQPFNSKESRKAAITGTAATLGFLSMVGATVLTYGLVSSGAADEIADRIRNR